MEIKKYPARIIFPLWPYFKQLFVDKAAVVNPFKFWQNYKIQLLENCWKLDSISLLEKMLEM